MASSSHPPPPPSPPPSPSPTPPGSDSFASASSTPVASISTSRPTETAGTSLASTSRDTVVGQKRARRSSSPKEGAGQPYKRTMAQNGEAISSGATASSSRNAIDTSMSHTRSSSSSGHQHSGSSRGLASLPPRPDIPPAHPQPVAGPSTSSSYPSAPLHSPTLTSPNPSITSASHPSWPRSRSCKLDLKDRSRTYWCSGSSSTRRNLQRPEQITSFSYDEERKLFHDDRSLKYFHAPPMKVDLGRGMENLRERDATRVSGRIGQDDETICRRSTLTWRLNLLPIRQNEHLDSLLYSLMHLAASSPDGSSDLPRRRADVITWRGMATKLFSALYEEQNTFSMNVMLVNDTLYIEEWVSPEAKAAKEKQMQDERQRRMGYYGYAFESWCTHSRDVSRGERIDFDYAHDDPWDGDVNTNVQWCSVVKTKLGELRLILGGEVDCVDPRPPAPETTSSTAAAAPAPPALVELKTTAVLRRPQDEVHFEKKMLRFFLQSYLLGVDRVLVGFRDQRGFLQATHDFKTVEMPGLLKGKPHAWDRGGCCNLAWAILNFVKERVKEKINEEGAEQEKEKEPKQEPNKDVNGGAAATPAHPPSPALFRLDFARPFREVRLTRLTPEEIDEIKGADVSRVGFLPRDYYDFAMRTQRVYV